MAIYSSIQYKQHKNFFIFHSFPPHLTIFFFFFLTARYLTISGEKCHYMSFYCKIMSKNGMGFESKNYDLL